MMAVQAGGKPEMMNESDSDDDKPIVFKRNNTASKQNQLNTQVKNSSSQKLDGKSGRQMSDVCSPNGQNSSVQKGKIVPSTKGSPVISPLASPKASTSSVKASLVKSPVANTKALTSVSDQSKSYSQQNKSTIVKKEKPLGRPHVDPYGDSEDDTPLSHRLLVGASNGSSHHVSKGSSNSVPVSSAFSKPSVKEEDSEDEKPLSLKFQLKSNAGASASNCSDSDENKPLASKLQQNGSGVMDNQLKKSSTALNKRPSAEAKYSVQSSVKKAKLSNASTSINCKQVSVKAEPSGKDDADDHVPISQRIKKSATPVSKLSDKKKTTTSISSSVNKINMKSKKMIKKTKFSKSSKVPPGSGEGQKWATLVHNGVIFPPPYKPHGVKMNYKGQPVNLTPEQEEVATMIAVMRDTEYWTKPMFIENFMSDWKKILGKTNIIQNFKDCDFDPIYEWHQREKEKKKQMSTEEKKALKEEKMKQEEKYMWAIVDGVKEKDDDEADTVGCCTLKKENVIPVPPNIVKVSLEEENVFEEIEAMLRENGPDSNSIAKFHFPTENAVESLRYRSEDVARSVTKISVRESRAQDLRNEILNSEKKTASTTCLLQYWVSNFRATFTKDKGRKYEVYSLYICRYIL